MGAAKIAFKLGGLDFSGEGDEQWVASQLDKILEKAPELIGTPAALTGAGESSSGNDVPANAAATGSTSVPLAKFLQEKDASTSQVGRFLATAEWLTMRGSKRLLTADVSKALQDNQQKN